VSIAVISQCQFQGHFSNTDKTAHLGIFAEPCHTTFSCCAGLWNVQGEQFFYLDKCYIWIELFPPPPICALAIPVEYARYRLIHSLLIPTTYKCGSPACVISFWSFNLPYLPLTKSHPSVYPHHGQVWISCLL
jgi:hypothetical protein